MSRQKQKQNSETYKLTSKMNFFIILIFIIVIIAALYFTFLRYKWIGQSIRKGDIQTTALLFTPELSYSLASILYR